MITLTKMQLLLKTGKMFCVWVYGINHVRGLMTVGIYMFIGAGLCVKFEIEYVLHCASYILPSLWLFCG